MGWNGRSKSFAAQVRAAALQLGQNGAEFSAGALSHASGIQDRDGEKRLTWVVRDFKRTGELLPVSKGVYRLGERATTRPVPKKQVMWRTLRGRRTVTVDDLIEFAGVSRDYAGEWLRVLVRRGVVRNLPDGKYQLVKDSVEQPADDRKAERLRALRAERKERLERALNDAQIRMNQAATLIDLARDELATLFQERPS